jgi:hypothetical protein
MSNIDGNANNSRGYAFYGPVGWSLEGADPGVGFDEANACSKGDLALFVTTFLFSGIAMMLGFDYTPFKSWGVYPLLGVLFGLFAWAMAARTRRVLSEPLLYPKKWAIAGSLGYGILLLLAAAYAAAFVRTVSWTEGGAQFTSLTEYQPNLIFAWVSLFAFHVQAVSETSAHARAIARSGLMAGYIGKGRMGPEIKSVRKYAFKIYFWIYAVLIAIIALEILLAHHLGWI